MISALLFYAANLALGYELSRRFLSPGSNEKGICFFMAPAAGLSVMSFVLSLGLFLFGAFAVSFYSFALVPSWVALFLLRQKNKREKKEAAAKKHARICANPR